MIHSEKKRILLGSLFVIGQLLAAHLAFAQQDSASESSDRRDEDARAQNEQAGEQEREEQEQSETRVMFVYDSRTGYIDNAIIGTHFRLRTDSGSDIRAPDRAEFFYAACGCARIVPNPPADAPNMNGEVLNPAAPGPAGEWTWGQILSSRLIETSLDYQEVSFDYEHAFSTRFSMFFEVPYRSVEGQVLESYSGIGDVRAGLKLGLLNNLDHQLTFQLRAYFPTGDAEKGLGTDHSSIEPGLLYYGRLSGGWNLAAELRYWSPIGGTTGRGTGFSESYAGDVVRAGFGFGYDFHLRSETTLTPVVEVVSWSVRGGLMLTSADGTPAGTTVPGFGYSEAKGDPITNLKVGLRFGFREGKSLYVGYGTALTDSWWYDNIVRVEYRMGFGRER